MWRFEAIGTQWTITTSPPVATNDRTSVTELIEAFDATWSRFRPDSLIAGLRRGERVDLGPDAPMIFELYGRLHEATGGAMNPLVGASLEHLGYDAEYSLTPGDGTVAAPDLGILRREGSIVSSAVPVTVDIGAVGKGLLAQRVADLLLERGTHNVVDAGGDIVNRSGSRITVALEHPGNPELAIGTAQVDHGEAICGSAPNRRKWADHMHHVIDARTGEPTRDIVATWAVGVDAAECDGISTAAFFVAEERLGWSDCHVLTLNRHGHISALGWPGETFA